MARLRSYYYLDMSKIEKDVFLKECSDAEASHLIASAPVLDFEQVKVLMGYCCGDETESAGGLVSNANLQGPTLDSLMTLVISTKSVVDHHLSVFGVALLNHKNVTASTVKHFMVRFISLLRDTFVDCGEPAMLFIDNLRDSGEYHEQLSTLFVEQLKPMKNSWQAFCVNVLSQFPSLSEDDIRLIIASSRLDSPVRSALLKHQGLSVSQRRALEGGNTCCCKGGGELSSVEQKRIATEYVSSLNEFERSNFLNSVI